MRQPRTSADVGRLAEDYAAAYVASLGWRVLGRNVVNRCGELDITALDSQGEAQELVIVEVRFRAVGELQSPLESVGPKKLRSLIRAARLYVDKIGWEGFWRIDLAGITASRPWDPASWRLEHIRDITCGMDVLT